MALRFIKRMYYQGKVVAYLKKNGSVLRYKLASIEERYLTSLYRVKPYYPLANADELNKEIDSLEEKIDETVGKILYANPKAKITNAIIDEAFAQTPKIEEEEETERALLYDFNIYINEMKARKAEEDRERGIERNLHPSCKDYISTMNALADYEYDFQFILYTSDITPEFIDDFVDYLAEDREDKTSSGYKYKTQGGLKNSTINKRLDCLASLTRNYYKNHELTEMILQHKQYNEQGEVIRLNKDELMEFASMEFNSETENRIKDFFVFLCLTGLRFSDFIKINKLNFRPNKECCSLLLFTQKTQKRAEIPLTPRAYEIARKYKFSFSYYTNQAFNRMLKELLDKYDLFGDELTKIDLVKKGIRRRVIKRRDVISAHTGRRTFISILVEEGVNISRIMAMTGHKKETTLKIYVDRFSPNLKESILPLNF